jgi:hypothetical protein
MSFFFESDKTISQARLRSQILITELTGINDLAAGLVKNGAPTEEISAHLELLRNETQKLDRESGVNPFELYPLLVPDKFSFDVAAALRNHLEIIRNHYKKLQNTEQSKKDQLIGSISRQQGKEYLYQLKMSSHNKALESLLLNAEASEYYRKVPGHRVQMVAPVFIVPDNRYGRAHFYAPVKRVGNTEINTFAFNGMVIWMMSGALWLVLYYDLLRKMISLQALRPVRKKKRPV